MPDTKVKPNPKPNKTISFEVATRLYKNSRVDMPKRLRKGKTPEEIIKLRFAAFIHNLKSQYGIEVLKPEAEAKPSIELMVKCSVCIFRQRIHNLHGVCRQADSPMFDKYVNDKTECKFGKEQFGSEDMRYRGDR